jgi:hypothetical protein
LKAQNRHTQLLTTKIAVTAKEQNRRLAYPTVTGSAGKSPLHVDVGNLAGWNESTTSNHAVIECRVALVDPLHLLTLTMSFGSSFFFNEEMSLHQT